MNWWTKSAHFSTTIYIEKLLIKLKIYDACTTELLSKVVSVCITTSSRDGRSLIYIQLNTVRYHVYFLSPMMHIYHE